MFKKLLIANRGEIACRIMRTCRRLGIGTIAVYSEADVNARHVHEADHAICIGPALPRQSYLNAECIIQAALAAHADAIHPGYGFLSEKTELIDACARHGIEFIGPHRDAIVRMGSKIESKRIARSTGVICVPGYDGDDQADDILFAEAERIGFPLLIKASAGGGGKGMRRVDRIEDLATNVADARQEAMISFGDDRILLEKLVLRPRHLEVQIWGDRHGNMLHLFERECSIQRNYQKIIEEAPAKHLTDMIRERLYSASVALGRSIHYDSIGTVEFVLESGTEHPWFLEMNTRLQVEHPVTELTTGLDLVECQLRSALGEPITLRQESLRRDGWAIEARINAESPEHDFTPTSGQIKQYIEPCIEGVRVDSGVQAGSKVTPHYDSMIAKLIAHASSREVAIERLYQSLGIFKIVGLATNQPMLREIILCEAFSTELTTEFLKEQFPHGYRITPTNMNESNAATAAAAFFLAAPITSDQPMAVLRGYRLSMAAGITAFQTFHVSENGDSTTVHVEVISPQRVRSHVGDHFWEYVEHPSGVLGNRGVHECHRESNGEFHSWINGEYHRRRIETVLDRAVSPRSTVDTADSVVAPMPGVVCEVLVKAGDTVLAGQKIGSLEAMKLIHTLSAPRDGSVGTVAVKVGDTVSQNALFLTLAR